MFPVLRPILNKGGAGHYISRQESAERLQPIIAQHLALLRSYTVTQERLGAGPAREQMTDVVLPNVRTELNKLYETVFSLGGSAPTGVDLDWESAPEATDERRFRDLLDLDKQYGDALREEAEAVHHQERTRAILLHNAEKSDERLAVLRGFVNA